MVRQRVKVKGDPKDSDLLTWREQPVTGKAIVKGSPGVEGGGGPGSLWVWS